MNKEAKKKLIRDVTDFTNALLDEASDSIEVEEFGSSTTLSVDYVAETIIDLIADLFETYQPDVQTLRNIFKPLSISEINEEMTMGNMYDFDELTEVDSSEDSESECKYVYRTIIFEHVDGDYLSYTVQMGHDYEWISFEYNGVVQKKEILRYEWG